MIFDLLAPGGGAKNKCAVAHPIHVSNSHTKFGLISSNGLGGDNVTDGRTDGGDCNIPDAFLKKRGDNYFKMHALSTSMLIKMHYCCCIPHLCSAW